jgi:predicted transcriptional regulator
VGANDQTVLDSLQGLTEPLDIKAVAGKAGRSHHTASYTLKKLAGKGLLTQSSVAGGRGMPKLVFALASNGQVAQAGATTSKAASLQMSETTALAAPKRKLVKKLDAGTKLQRPHRQTENEFLAQLLYPLSHGDRRTSRQRTREALAAKPSVLAMSAPLSAENPPIPILAWVNAKRIMIIAWSRCEVTTVASLATGEHCIPAQIHQVSSRFEDYGVSTTGSLTLRLSVSLAGPRYEVWVQYTWRWNGRAK